MFYQITIQIILLDYLYAYFIQNKNLPDQFYYTGIHMNNIKEIIQERIKYIRHKNVYTRVYVQQDYEYLKLRLQFLLKEKRLETIREIKQVNQLHILHSQKTIDKKDIKQFYQISKHLMSMNQCRFLNNYIQSQDDTSNAIFLYVQFFKEQSYQNQSYEILNIYNKQLCENNALLITLLSWFSEWSKKTFTNTLKNEMTTVKNLLSKLEKTYEISDQKKISIKQSRSLTNEIKIKQINRTDSKDSEENFMINRQLFYGAFCNEMLQIYRTNLSAIHDLDIYYIKTLKKQELKNEIIQNISKLAKSFVVSVSCEHKKAIQNYKNEYFEKHQNLVQQYQTQEKKMSELFFQQRLTQTKKKLKFINEDLVVDTNNLHTNNTNPPHLSLEFKKREMLNSIKAKNIGNSNLLFSKRYVEYNLPHLELSPRQTKQSRFNQVQVAKQQRFPIALKSRKNHMISDQIPKYIGQDISFSFSKQEHNRYISLSFKQKYLESSNSNNSDIKKDDLKKKQTQRITQIMKILERQPIPSRSNVFYLPKLNKE